MEKYYQQVKTKIINDKVCIFEFQILSRKFFFCRKVVYADECVVCRNREPFLINAYACNEEVSKSIGYILAWCDLHAKTIFDAYGSKKDSRHQYTYEQNHMEP